MSIYFIKFLKKNIEGLKEPLFSEDLITRYKNNLKLQGNDELLDIMENTLKELSKTYISYVLDNNKYLIILPDLSFDINLNIK